MSLVRMRRGGAEVLGFGGREQGDLASRKSLGIGADLRELGFGGRERGDLASQKSLGIEVGLQELGFGGRE